MKALTTTTMICLLFGFSASAQNWTLGGNSQMPQLNNPVKQRIGTRVDRPFRLITDCTQRIYIDNSTTGFVGVGDAFSTPQSLLHVYGINNNTGNLFQTTGSKRHDNTWMMSVESNFYAPRFSVTIPANSFDAEIQTHKDGEINFTTNTDHQAVTRSVSIQGGVGDVVHGQMALGNALPDGFNARSRLHLHKTVERGANTGGNFVQFTSTNSIGGDAPGQTSGFMVGVSSTNNDAYIRQNENSPIRFTTGGPFIQRMTILANVGDWNEGFIGMNTANPTSRVDINGDLRIRKVNTTNSPACILVGEQHGGNANDQDVRRIDFPNDPNVFLNGAGEWTSMGANRYAQNENTDASGQSYEELIARIDAQQAELDVKDVLISDLNQRLSALENCLSNILPELCEINARAVESTPEEVQEELRSVINVDLSDQNTIILNQNVPNPFAERTTITYSIPETVGKAQIHFYDAMGALINSVEITDRGAGELNVFASDLSRGIYSYSLVADGSIIATKRMMKQ